MNIPGYIFIIVFISICPILMGVYIRYQNFEKHEYMLKNNVILYNNLTYPPLKLKVLTKEHFLPRQFIIYSVNNTDDLYIARIRKKHCRTVERYTKHKRMGVTTKEFIGNEVLCDYTFLGETASVVLEKMNLSISQELHIWIPDVLTPDNISCNGTELQKIITNFSLITNDNYANYPTDVFHIDYGKIPKDQYPMIYYGIEFGGNNSEIVINYITSNPEQIVEYIYPVFGPIIIGIVTSFFISIIGCVIGGELVMVKYATDKEKDQ